MTSIAGSAFLNCTGLTSIFSYIENPFYLYSLFNNDIYKNATLYVPKGTTGKYKTCSPWKYFANIVEMDGTDGIENNNLEKITDNRYFNLNGQLIEGQPSQKGVYIKNGKKVLMK